MLTILQAILAIGLVWSSSGSKPLNQTTSPKIADAPLPHKPIKFQ